MQYLFIKAGAWNGEKFDSEKLKRDLESIEGVTNINGKNLEDSTVACYYKFNGYTDIVRLENNLETITIDSNSETSWNLALELQKRDSRDLRIFNDDYDFHFSLKDIKSLEELKQKVKEGYFDEQALKYENEAQAA